MAIQNTNIIKQSISNVIQTKIGATRNNIIKTDTRKIIKKPNTLQNGTQATELNYKQKPSVYNNIRMSKQTIDKPETVQSIYRGHSHGGARFQ